MLIKNDADLAGMKKVSEAVAETLRQMVEFTAVGKSTKEIDDFGAEILKKYGAKSAPYETYKFPGFTCIGINEVAAHGIPSEDVIIKEGDLINIDVSAELDGYWADNGKSFIVGQDTQGLQSLVDASTEILKDVIYRIKKGVKVSEVGRIIESESRKRGFKVIKNLAGHGVGKSLHEAPDDILNYQVKTNKNRFKANTTVAIETFISTQSNLAVERGDDGWTLVGNRGGFVAQHEHTILITEDKPEILTEMNGVF
ncbi:type I methionyl aminopeptidase [Flammeovirga sp. EKP202]|uniref:type I methionyl aminopeptidase n=1 Tax=Flammeovirga sp. EKP202 TaxID=2770592 RepID=UPI00165FC163|nr:type I methionyl aminopeptidase [Flammeovirga sp. EKP202]MBD0403957.1 type I methionyl aminopeptidase [Flammeovirga sp. EKP202]